MKVYVSGGITGVARWRDRFEAAAEMLDGLPEVSEVITPPEIDACADGSCEEWPSNPRSNGHTWCCWLKHDIAELALCDAIATLPGWERSRGATLEMSIAIQLGLKVFSVDEMLLDQKMIEREVRKLNEEDGGEMFVMWVVPEVDGL